MPIEQLTKICASPLNLKIIGFFHENPATVDTPRNIAAWLNHDHQQVQKALDFLAENNILAVHGSGSTLAYSYTQANEIINQVEQILKTKK